MRPLPSRNNNNKYLVRILRIVSKKKSSGVDALYACISGGGGGVGIDSEEAACRAACSNNCSLYFSHMSRHSKMLSA